MFAKTSFAAVQLSTTIACASAFVATFNSAFDTAFDTAFDALSTSIASTFALAALAALAGLAGLAALAAGSCSSNTAVICCFFSSMNLINGVIRSSNCCCFCWSALRRTFAAALWAIAMKLQMKQMKQKKQKVKKKKNPIEKSEDHL
jgi:hypothetical protein